MTSLLHRIANGTPQAANPGPLDDFYYNPIDAATASAAGIRVTPDLALKLSAFYAAVRIKSGIFASLPWLLYKHMRTAGKERATDHRLYQTFHLRPNRWQTSFAFREMMYSWAMVRGNAYARIQDGPMGPDSEMVPLHPDRMAVSRLDNGRTRYRFQGDDGIQRDFDEAEIIHIPWTLIGSTDGITGVSLVRLAAESLGLASAAERYAGKMFADGSSHGIILEHPEQLGEETAKRIESSWQSSRSGANIHKVTVLEEGMKASRVGITAEDAQLLESRKFDVTVISRWTGLPPHILGDLERATFSNITEQSIEFLQYHLVPDLERWEQAIDVKMLTGAEQAEFFTEFLVDGLLRGSTKDRYAAFQMADWMTPNEKRAAENMAPLEGLDQPFMPVNKAPANSFPRQMQQGGQPPPSPSDDAARSERAFAMDAAGQVIRRETSTLTRLHKQAGADGALFVAEARRYYESDARAWLAENKGLSDQAAGAWCGEQAEDVEANGFETTSTWPERRQPVMADILVGVMRSRIG